MLPHGDGIVVGVVGPVHEHEVDPRVAQEDAVLVDDLAVIGQVGAVQRNIPRARALAPLAGDGVPRGVGDAHHSVLVGGLLIQTHTGLFDLHVIVVIDDILIELIAILHFLYLLLCQNGLASRDVDRISLGLDGVAQPAGDIVGGHEDGIIPLDHRGEAVGSAVVVYRGLTHRKGEGILPLGEDGGGVGLGVGKAQQSGGGLGIHEGRAVLDRDGVAARVLGLLGEQVGQPAA